jgi:hypothetical protein
MLTVQTEYYCILGPVNALAKALYKALLPYFPSLQHVVLKDYKVQLVSHSHITQHYSFCALLRLHTRLTKLVWALKPSKAMRMVVLPMLMPTCA